MVDCCLPSCCLCFCHCCLPSPLRICQLPHRRHDVRCQYRELPVLDDDGWVKVDFQNITSRTENAPFCFCGDSRSEPVLVWQDVFHRLQLKRIVNLLHFSKQICMRDRIYCIVKIHRLRVVIYGLFGGNKEKSSQDRFLQCLHRN